MKKKKYNCSYFILSWYGYVIELKKKCEGVPWHPQVFFLNCNKIAIYNIKKVAYVCSK
jgi:hypothetical protein